MKERVVVTAVAMNGEVAIARTVGRRTEFWRVSPDEAKRAAADILDAADSALEMRRQDAMDAEGTA